MARIAKVVAGFGLIAAGLVMLVVPGPGILTILAGLALVAQEYTWARQLFDWVKRRFGGRDQRARADQTTDTPDPGSADRSEESPSPASPGLPPTLTPFAGGRDQNDQAGG